MLRGLGEKLLAGLAGHSFSYRHAFDLSELGALAGVVGRDAQGAKSVAPLTESATNVRAEAPGSQPVTGYPVEPDGAPVTRRRFEGQGKRLEPEALSRRLRPRPAFELLDQVGGHTPTIRTLRGDKALALELEQPTRGARSVTVFVGRAECIDAAGVARDLRDAPIDGPNRELRPRAK
jgi:hypothetical protein